VRRTPTYSELAKSIVEVTRKIAKATAEPKADWFEKRKDTLIPHINARNYTLLQSIKKPCHHNKAKLQTAHHHLKRSWQRSIVEKCYLNNPKQMWDIAKEIEKRFTGHFKKIVPQ
jgi:hypothetical protein